MIGERVALLLGLFVAPVVLLGIGYRLRNRTTRSRGMFWGGIGGHTAGLLIATAAMLLPPIWWAGGGFWRDFAVHWSMLLGCGLGCVAGRYYGGRSGRPSSEGGRNRGRTRTRRGTHATDGPVTPVGSRRMRD
jgi:hypothetical protein